MNKSEWLFYFRIVAHLINFHIKEITNKRFYQIVIPDSYTRHELLTHCDNVQKGKNEYEMINYLISRGALKLDPDKKEKKYYFINEKRMVEVLQESDLWKVMKPICDRWE